MSRRKYSSAIYRINHNLFTPPEYIGFITDTKRKIENEVGDFNSLISSTSYYEEDELVKRNLFPARMIVSSHEWVNRPKYKIMNGEDILHMLDEHLNHLTENTKNCIRKLSDLPLVKAYIFIPEYNTENSYFKILKLFLEEELDIRGYYNNIENYQCSLFPDDSKLPIFKNGIKLGM